MANYKISQMQGYNKDRESNDFYPTPPKATIMLLEKERFEGTVWEPACGDGAISKLLPDATISTDLYNRGYGESGVDFLTTYKEVDHIITNPPYRLAKEFVLHGLECANSKVAMLCKLNFLESVSRYKMFKSTPLSKVYVFSNRLSFDKGNQKGKGSGLLAYAWFVWDKNYKGDPRLDWLLEPSFGKTLFENTK
jgi:hypothetical protein